MYIRAYNGGSAFRFVIEELSKEESATFYMEYDLSAEASLYMPVREAIPKGHIWVEDLKQMENQPKWFVPIVAEVPDQGFISLLESDLLSASGFELIQFGYDR